MTKEFNIESIAIIGGGPAGLVTLNEFLHTAKDGSSTINEDKLPATPAFKKVVVFEQKDKVGGVWATDVDNTDSIPEEIWKTGKYNRPEVIHPKIKVPEDLTLNSTVESPLITKAADEELQWKRSGVYPGLYTNVPRRFLRFSSIKWEEPKHTKVIDPLITYQEVTKVLEDFASNNDLYKNIRLNTQVEDVSKTEDGKWLLTLRRLNKETGKNEWYKEKFDAVVVGSGHYSVPYVPYFEGIETREPNSVIHSKSFRNAEDYRDKNVIVVGSSLSGIDLVQYIYPIAKSLTISRTPGKEEIYPWITRAAVKFDNKPRISKFEGKKVYFEDGTFLDDIDKIIIATGYHWDYPYLSDKFLHLTTQGNDTAPTGSSRVKGLYYDTFNINDPTLGFVGVTLTALKFHTLETSAAALAGIWSNAKTLPSEEEQYKWEQDRINATADNLYFHYYTWDVTKKEWADKIFEYAPLNRKNPLDGEPIDQVYPEGFEAAERVFLDLKDEKIKYEDTIWK